MSDKTLYVMMPKEVINGKHYDISLILLLLCMPRDDERH